VHVENNLAIFDYEKCTSCGACVKECPTNTIMNYRAERKERGLWPVKKPVTGEEGTGTREQGPGNRDQGTGTSDL